MHLPCLMFLEYVCKAVAGSAGPLALPIMPLRIHSKKSMHDASLMCIAHRRLVLGGTAAPGLAILCGFSFLGTRPNTPAPLCQILAHCACDSQEADSCQPPYPLFCRRPPATYARWVIQGSRPSKMCVA